MENLVPAVRSILVNDDILMNIVSSVRYWRTPREPKTLVKPMVSFRMLDFSDKDGHHGATIIPIIQISVWSYDQNTNPQIIDATKAANRISDILCTRRIVVPGGGSTRITLLSGWNTLDEQDPNTIHLLGRFATSYWSSNRIELLSPEEES